MNKKFIRFVVTFGIVFLVSTTFGSMLLVEGLTNPDLSKASSKTASVNFTDDLFLALKLQDQLQTKYTGGTVFHTFLGESQLPIVSVKQLLKKVTANYRLPYITLSPTFSICPNHDYLFGEHKSCPKCKVQGVEQKCTVFSRIVGYLRPINQWNDGKQEEFKDRKMFKNE